MKRIIIIFIMSVSVLIVRAQIGYQVSLLNKATGEPRANETVSVSVVISDSCDGVIYNGTMSSTTNDFGVLSLSVGDANTFANVDWNKLPLYISATVDNVLIGRSQVLSVPVAEHARHYGCLTRDFLKSREWKWYGDGYYQSFVFTDDSILYKYEGHTEHTYPYYISGNDIFVITNSSSSYRSGKNIKYCPDGDFLYQEDGDIYR